MNDIVYVYALSHYGRVIKKNIEYRKLLREYLKLQDDIDKKLDEEGRAMLERLFDVIGDMESIADSEESDNGFILGVTDIDRDSDDKK